VIAFCIACYTSGFLVHEIILSVLFASHFSFVRYVIVKNKKPSMVGYNTLELKVDKLIDAYHSKYKRLVTGMIISYTILYITKNF
jgi:hypothetical protein